MLSRGQQRKAFLFLVLSMSLMSIVVFFLQQRWKAGWLPAARCPIRVQSSTFTKVPGSKTLLINAFREHRTANASVRLLAVVFTEEDPLWSGCVFCCQDEGEVIVSAQRTTHPSHYFFPYGTGDFLCQIPFGCKPSYVGLVSEDSADRPSTTFLPILNQNAPERSSLPLNLTLCMPTMFNGYNNVLQFVQAMELYRLLGIQRAIIYKTDCSATMEMVLHYYSHNVGFLQVLPWPIDSHLKPSSSWLPSLSPGEIHYYGQIPANNDCMYRNMHRSRYVLMHDPDEVIVPTGNVSFETLMSDLERAHGEKVNFHFANNVFPHEEKDENSKYDLPEWKHLPGTNFLVHTLRELDTSGYNSGKLILDPRSVLQMEVHAIQAHFEQGRTQRIAPEQARLFHIRRRKNSQQTSKDLVRDKGLLRLAQALVPQVNRALSRIGLLNATSGTAPRQPPP